MTTQLNLIDGRNASVRFGLFEAEPLPPTTGPGFWVQLGGDDLSPEALGQRRSEVEQAGGSLVGVVPEALLWPAVLPTFSQAVHVEICREYARISLLRDEDRIVVGETIHLRDCGLKVVEKQLAAGVAAASVKQTRFDPLHSAGAEVELHAAIGDAMQALRSGAETDILLGGESITITATQVSGWCQPIWGRLVQGIGRLTAPPDFVMLAPCGQLPNLTRSLQSAFADKFIQIPESASRDEAVLRAWLLDDLPMTSCWLLQTRPRSRS